MADKTCYKCNQIVGRNHDGKWLYYRKVSFGKRNVCYNCDFICWTIDQTIWKCNGCEKYYSLLHVPSSSEEPSGLVLKLKAIFQPKLWRSICPEQYSQFYFLTL